MFLLFCTIFACLFWSVQKLGKKDIWRYEIKKGVICCGIEKNYINLHIH